MEREKNIERDNEGDILQKETYSRQRQRTRKVHTVERDKEWLREGVKERLMQRKRQRKEIQPETDKETTKGPHKEAYKEIERKNCKEATISKRTGQRKRGRTRPTERDREGENCFSSNIWLLTLTGPKIITIIKIKAIACLVHRCVYCTCYSLDKNIAHQPPTTTRHLF